ncbi:MAG: PEP-CTERM sorting domain-containing protein, partial [Phycisphaeraceae bacterium]|nr:PEP-CTERM sorting domain-containing protein [Phycisphaeraceae bacterium]
QILGDNWGSSDAYWLLGDFTGDGSVNLADLQVLGDNWGTGTGTGTDLAFADALRLAGLSLPEPSSIILLLVLSAGLCRRRASGVQYC